MTDRDSEIKPANVSYAFVPDNARNEDRQDILRNFIPPKLFWELFSPQHHIILGSRGSGKTSVAKMASYPFLSKSNLKRAKELSLTKDFIGVFVNTDVRFVGTTKDNFLSQNNISQMYFKWKFNLNCLKSLSLTLDCLLEESLGDTAARFLVEADVSAYICKNFLHSENTFRLKELDEEISEFEFVRRSALNSSFLQGAIDLTTLGSSLTVEIFDPVSAVIRALKKSLNRHVGDNSEISKKIKKTKWLFFIDEAEYLTLEHIKILNSFMRTHTGGIFLKIATLPYKHQTLETNLGVQLQVEDDFFYKSLDQDPIYGLNSENIGHLYSFAHTLYSKRVRGYVQMRGMNLPQHMEEKLSDFSEVVGKSALDEPKPLPLDLNIAVSEMSKVLNERTMSRVKKLKSDRERLGNEIWRKVSGLALLKNEHKKLSGRRAMTVYSGTSVCIRCTDGVPRRMINLFHGISLEAFASLSNSRGKNKKSSGESILTPVQQTRIVKAYSAKRVDSSRGVLDLGPKLREFLERVALYFQYELHHEKISTDVISTFRVTSDVDKDIWSVIQEGCAYGYIFKTSSVVNPSYSPEGIYRLAYALCPNYDLYPRKGKSRSISAVLESKRGDAAVEQLMLELGNRIQFGKQLS